MYRLNCSLPIIFGHCLPTMVTPFVIELVSEVYGLLRRVSLFSVVFAEMRMHQTSAQVGV